MLLIIWNEIEMFWLMTNYTFDPSIEQIFATLLYEGTLYLIKKISQIR